MYWALGEEPEHANPSKTHVKMEHHMTTYPVEFHRRLEQNWASRIDFLSRIGNTRPPRDPNDDDDEEEDEDEEDEDQPDEPAVVREPDED